MNVNDKDLDDAVAEGIISAEQSASLIAFLKGRPGVGPAFNFTNLLYYFGGLVAIGAMTVFMNLGWEEFGGWGIFWISLGYAAVGLKLSDYFKKQGHAIPAGICVTFVVTLTPLAIYGLQQANGWWPGEDVYRDYHR